MVVWSNRIKPIARGWFIRENRILMLKQEINVNNFKISKGSLIKF